MIWDFVFGFIALTIIMVPLHELGHWIAAKKNGWKNLGLKIEKWHGFPYTIAVHADGNLKIESEHDFFVAYFAVTRFYAMGSIFSIMGLLVCGLFGIFSESFVLLLTQMFVVYLMWELNSCKTTKREE